MKRTELKRKTPLKAKSPMKRGAGISKKRSTTKGAISRVKSNREWPSYLAFVRTLNCAMTGRPAEVAHHIIGVGNFSGMGIKAPDYLAMPLTHEAHHQIHTEPELWPLQWEWVVRTQARAIEAGVLVLNSRGVREEG